MPSRTLAERLTAYAVLAHDPAVPGIAADYWELSEPHYRAVDALLAGFLADRPDAARPYEDLVADPTALAPQLALRRRLARSLAAGGEERARLAAAVEEADRHIWIDYHLGDGDGVAPDEAPAAGTGTVSGPAVAHLVIPFRDRDADGLRTRNLLACLRALADQGPSPAHHVTVVETDDRPRSRALLEPLVDAYVFAENPGLFNKSWAVNVGARTVPDSVPYLCVLDADILVDRAFIRRNVGRIADGAHGTHLPFRWSLSLDEPSSLRAIHARTVAGLPDVPESALRGLLLREPPGGCVWVRTEVFHRVGGFDERYEGWGGEDDDVIARLTAAAGVVRFEDPLLHLNHPRPQMTREGAPFNAHIEPLSWTAAAGYGDPSAFAGRKDLHPGGRPA
ncbi:galactosyltransferase-related protein [Streptomyces netropsis]|uniref:galactosyltransferase-related protein n=1 Tax=Streptomyces netropsis TaxID=55404 RepID=UPI0037B92CAA